MDFATAQSTALAALSPDQVNDLITYLDGPKDIT
jgi:hypothetical protein